jgi:hypothetical protein
MPSDHRQPAYDRICESYHAVDDFRMKLLGLLPVATGTGVFLLLNSNTDLLGPGTSEAQQHTLERFLVAIGAFGLLFTLGLFLYELFGVKRCHYLIEAGKRLEFELDVRGQFRSRPQNLLGFINEPVASALIYPASMAAWTYLALAYTTSPWRLWTPAAVFLLGLLVTVGIAEGIEHKTKKAFRNEVYVQLTQGDATVRDLAESLHADPEEVKAAVKMLCRRDKVATADGKLTVVDHPILTR